ncbi:hypothetical protein OA408_00375 [Acidimicrobiaceae bacterium]|nr:hypothetical protein [Acidimicrobiaceae bacterium]
MIKRSIFLFKKKFLWKFFTFLYLNKIYSFFDYVKDESYVLVKENVKFPHINLGSDLDIYTQDADTFSKLIKNYFDSKNINVTKNQNQKGNVHVDLFYYNKFIYKFDLYDLNYESKIFNSEFIKSVLSNKEIRKFKYFKIRNIYVPSVVMDIIIRVFEIQKFPDKLHHKEKLTSYDKDFVLAASSKISNYTKENLSLTFSEIFQND